MKFTVNNLLTLGFGALGQAAAIAGGVHLCHVQSDWVWFGVSLTGGMLFGAALVPGGPGAAADAARAESMSDARRHARWTKDTTVTSSKLADVESALRNMGMKRTEALCLAAAAYNAEPTASVEVLVKRALKRKETA